MTTIESTAMTIEEPGDGFEFDEVQLAAVSYLPATAAGRSRRTGMTCVASSSGPPTMG